MFKRLFSCGPIKTLRLKLRMMSDILLQNWNTAPLSGLDYHKEFFTVSEDEVRKCFAELDDKSISEAVKFVERQKNFYINDLNKDYFIYNHQKMFGSVRPYYKQHSQELKKYICDFVFGGIESLVFHHGLKECPEAVLHYIANGYFIDAGGCYGDSALVFFKYYNPAKVLTFEPGEENRKVYLELMCKNQIDTSHFMLYPYGLGNIERTVVYNSSLGGSNSLAEQDGGVDTVQVKKLDHLLSADLVDRVSLIKADIEGMGLEMLCGAEHIIRKKRPVLTLSIYHNKDEFFGIYRILLQWDLNYRIIIRHVNPTTANELQLIAWPKELG